MHRLVHNSLRTAVNAFVRAESLVLEQKPGSLNEIGTPIIVATHRRSGTHLTIDTLRRNFPECRPRMLPLENQHKSYFNIDQLEVGHPEPVTLGEAMRLMAKASRPTIKTHAEPGFPDIDPAYKSFVSEVADTSETLCITRDGRKVMCSLWVWRKRFEASSDIPFGDFIRQTDGTGRSRARVWSDHVMTWLAVPDVVHYSFEDLVKQAPRTLGEIGERMNLRLELADPPIPPAVRTRGEAWKARLMGDLTSTNHHAAGERTPKPEEVFTPDDIDFFRREASEGMSRLGYSI